MTVACFGISVPLAQTAHYIGSMVWYAHPMRDDLVYRMLVVVLGALPVAITLLALFMVH
jgi:hypothetical protein